MKRCFSLLLTLFLLFANIALAETDFSDTEFSIRSGIKYGMTLSEIKDCETSAGNELFDADVSIMFGKTDVVIVTDLNGSETMFAYMNDDNGRLRDFQYWMPIRKLYTSVKSSLIDKYGQPLFVNTPAPFDTKGLIASENLAKSGVSVQDYAAWILQYKDCVVIVEFCELGGKYVSNTGHLNYCVLPYEEAMPIITDLIQEADMAQQSLVTDI